MIILGNEDTNTVCRLLQMITRLQPGALPSALDQSTALDLGRKMRTLEVDQLNESDPLSLVFATLLKDGQGLTLGQEIMIRKTLAGGH